MISAEDTAFVDGTAQNQFAVFEVDLAVIEIARFGIQHFASLQVVLFLVILHPADDEQPFQRLVFVLPFAVYTDRVRYIDQQAREDALIQSVFGLIQVDHRKLFAGFVIHRCPFAKHGADLSPDGDAHHQKD